MKEKFLFCHNWFNTYQKSGAKHYDAIMDLVFTGSKISSNFIGCAVTHKDGERAWTGYQKHNTMASITKFIDKMHGIVEPLALPQE